MKEFEKWAGPGFYYGKDPLNRPTLEAKRKGWEAALEWVADKCRGRRSKGLFDLLKEIDKELSGE